MIRNLLDRVGAKWKPVFSTTDEKRLEEIMHAKT